MRYFISIVFLLLHTFVVFSLKGTLRDIRYLNQAASHGLQLSRQGSALVFKTEWSHIVKLEWPPIYELLWRPRRLSCAMFSSRKIPKRKWFNLTEHDRPPPHDINDGLRSICRSVNIALSDLAITVNELYTSISKEVKQTHIGRHERSFRMRNKRGLLPFVGQIAKELFGVGTEKDQNKLQREIEKLEFMISSQNRSTANLAKSFLGMSAMVDKQSKRFNHAITLLGDHMRVLDGQFERIWTVVDDIELYDEQAINSLFNIVEGLGLAISAMHNVTLLTNIFASWESALIQLRQGYIPLNVIPWSVLKEILLEIEKEVAPSYSLGIEFDDWENYYLLQLVTVSLTAEHAYVKIAVPLKAKGSKIKYDIINPVSHPIPCHSEVCTFKKKLNNDTKFIQLNLNSHVWLINTEDSDFQFNRYEISYA